MKTLAALDPGRDKCGFAVLQADGHVLYQQVIATEDLESCVRQAQEKFGFTHLIEGNGTTSREAHARIQKALPELAVTVIDEYRTTELAKEYYWQAHPRHGWRRLVPQGMQVPPEPVDDFVAVILGRRFIQREGSLADDLPRVPERLETRSGKKSRNHPES